MYIGEIARLTDASPKAIRHYESLGLLGRVTRAGSYRVYSENEVRQIKLIKQAQALGFRLSELRAVLEGHSGEPDWLGLTRQIDLKRTGIREEIQRLRSLDVHLGQINEEIRSCLGDEGRTEPKPDQYRNRMRDSCESK
ncbi:MAG: hypothetical protein A3I66_04620 [Burkholderiales bacterium RIFCSPLOWO2_02_FULL_57_36]|nr:MAG: hypothetical protein A3I66_04620 [Burkholderiales bacterium RIFCSPLOWO2_02_FULL_57_36]